MRCQKIFPCETCANAVWVGPEWDIGLAGGVDDCKANVTTSSGLEIIEDVLEGNRENCPHWLPKFPTEGERIRCPECNSPKWKISEIRLDLEKMETEITCKHCGHVQKACLYSIDYMPEITL